MQNLHSFLWTDNYISAILGGKYDLEEWDNSKESDCCPTFGLLQLKSFNQLKSSGSLQAAQVQEL